MDAPIALTIAGFVLVALLMRDAFETMILPRRLNGRFRFTRLYYRGTWPVWAGLCDHLGRRHRENLLSLYGPLSMLALFVLWALGMIVGFGLIIFASAPQLGLGHGFFLSGIRFLTLGLGEAARETHFSRTLAVGEGGLGFGFLAVVIAYLPVLYTGFSSREAAISRLDAHAGSPSSASELLRRHACNLDQLEDYLAEWERWSAQLLESHISYPVLGYFRSQHVNQSWLAALGTLLDSTALLLAASESGCSRQAQLTFAMARHAMVDLSQIFMNRLPRTIPDRLPAASFQALAAQLRAAGLPLRSDEAIQDQLADLRRLYEPHLLGLATHLRLRPPDWIGDPNALDNWQRSPWERPSPSLGRWLNPPPDRHF